MKKKYGIFYVEVPETEEELKRVKKALRDFFILRAEYYFDSLQIEYRGYHDDFRELSKGEIIPTYNITIDDRGEEYKVSVTERPH